MFFLVCNATYSYLTATTNSQAGSATTATVQIKFTGESVESVSTSSTVSEKIIPGDTLTIKAKIDNQSNVDIYLLIKLQVSVKKTTDSSASIVSKKFYSLSGSTLTEITQTAGSSTTDTSDDDFSSDAQKQTKNTISNEFKTTHVFDGATYDNNYIGATASYIITAYAIQYDNISQSTATQVLWNNANTN